MRYFLLSLFWLVAAGAGAQPQAAYAPADVAALTRVATQWERC